MKMEMVGGETLGQILTAPEHLVRAASDGFPNASETSHDPPPWPEAMRRAIRSSAQLRSLLNLPPQTAEVVAAERDFPTFVPLEYLSRILPGNPRDPLLLQVLPVADETRLTPGFSSDPVGDSGARVASQLLQKYQGRALVITTGVCGIHCRYCFRRSFDYSPAVAAAAPQVDFGGNSWDQAISHLQADSTIDEVILSGGDPLTLSDARFDRLISAVEAIEHVKRLRIHSRMPIVIPQRITAQWILRLKQSRLATWMVIHCNHAQEIDGAVSEAIARLVDSGIPVLNQAVLLAGVNDDAMSLVSLCRELVNRRVQPYYLHQLDRVAGAAHFEVPVEKGRALMTTIRAMLPGYAVPTYVTEIEGALSKVPN